LAVLNLETGARREIGPGSSAVYSTEGYLLHSAPSTSSPGLWALPFSLPTLEPTGEAFLIIPSGRASTVSLDGTLTYLGEKSPDLAMKTLVWRRRSNGEIIERVGQPQAGLREFALSPDRRRIATTVGEPSDVWIQDLTSGVATRLTFEPGYEYLPSWTPSGTDVAYSATSPVSPSHLMSKAADGMGEPSLVIEMDYPTMTSDWSRDGRYLVFNGPSGEGTASDIRYVELTADGGPFKAKTFLSTPANERAAKLSPNARFIAYVSAGAGQPEIYISPFPSGEGKRQVSLNGGTQPRWRDDGKELFYVENQNTLMAIPVSTEQALTTGQPQRLFESADLSFRNLPWPQYDVSADGQRFLTSTRIGDDPAPTVRIVQNWYEEFRDRER
jgi:Tol biopolymer transport system component